MIRVRISVVLINSIGGMKQIMKQEYNMIDPYIYTYTSIYIHIQPILGKPYEDPIKQGKYLPIGYYLVIQGGW